MSKKRTIPKHVAIIMDGNGRWATQRGMERHEGHIAGAKAVTEVIRAAGNIGVEYVTLYAFSTENWGRPAAEINAIMELFCDLRKERKTPLSIIMITHNRELCRYADLTVELSGGKLNKA